MYAIYGNIYHQYTPVMLAYIPYMDPMGFPRHPGEQGHAQSVRLGQKVVDVALETAQVIRLVVIVNNHRDHLQKLWAAYPAW